MTNSRSHTAAMVEMLRDDADFASLYLRTAFEELDEERGQAGFLVAMRQIVEARGGFEVIAEKAGLSIESLRRALSPKGNPTLRTMTSVIHATGVRLAIGS